jgi:hypothetical protein
MPFCSCSSPISMIRHKLSSIYWAIVYRLDLWAFFYFIYSHFTCFIVHFNQ